jgi:hypothetical protein
MPRAIPILRRISHEEAGARMEQGMLNGRSWPRIGQRGAIYGALLAASFLGPVFDSLAGTAYSTSGTLADFVLAIIFVGLTAWWCTTDAWQGGYRPPGRAARILVLLIVPVGLAVYLLQSRAFAQALKVFALYAGGVAGATILGGLAGDWLVPPGSGG